MNDQATIPQLIGAMQMAGYFVEFRPIEKYELQVHAYSESGPTHKATWVPSPGDESFNAAIRSIATAIGISTTT